uniref:C-type lectin domain-containing protein n=1 Tax=Sinocyclocheilus rhinocerous TaxID=307959 RepID=A0A673HQH3_9TELE
MYYKRAAHLTNYISCIFSSDACDILTDSSWSDAQMHCQRNYIDLATIDEQTDLDEMMRVIRQFHNGDVWTGLSRTDGNAPWVWSDQSPSTFMPSWADGQPNNRGGTQLCAGTSLTGTFNDADCYMQYAAVCYNSDKFNLD